MTDPVFIHPIPDEATPGFRFTLTGSEAKHTEVKRLKDGEGLVVSDGFSRAVRATWQHGQAQVEEVLAIPTPRPSVTIVQAIPKSDRAELAVDLAVQAGADRIVPWGAARCIAKWDGKEEKARTKWENAARSAAKQSRRLVVPEVTGLLRDVRQLGSFLGDATSSRRILVLDEQAAQPLSSVDLDVDEIMLVIGPEGGVAPEEIAAILELGGQAVVLGPEVLRTATAGAVALGALGVLTPRWAGR